MNKKKEKYWRVGITYSRTDWYEGIEADTEQEAIELAKTGECECTDKCDGDVEDICVERDMVTRNPFLKRVTDNEDE